MKDDETGGVLESIRSSQLLRIVLIGFLIILFRIPIGMIRGVVGERETRRREAIEEVTSKWGRAQTIIGPMLTVPYHVKIHETAKDGTKKVRTVLRWAHYLPDDLSISGKIDSAVRYRGIFKVPVYSISLNVKGLFSRPDFSEWGVDPGDIAWDRAHLTVRISDARAIKNQAFITWEGERIEFLPGVGEFGGLKTGIHARMKAHLIGDAFKFSYQLELNGSDGVFFAPFGRKTIVEIDSDWPDPSFQGSWLPSERTVGKEGFQAVWNIPFLGRNYPQKWRNESGLEDAVSTALFGVRLITPVDHYRMSQRSVKYDILFMTLTFVTLWLFEVLSRIRIHSIQYILVGAGMCLFYLLELSLGEHIGFTTGYILASLAVIGMISVYCIAILKSSKRAGIIGILISLLYVYLYILLMNQDYALLIGSIGLFLMLATVMYLTRKIEWHSLRG